MVRASPAIAASAALTSQFSIAATKAARALLAGGTAGTVVCDVAGIGPPGLAAVDLLARLEVTARRAGGRIRLRDPDPALLALLRFVGLRLQMEGEAEEREPALGVEEEVEPGQPAV